MVDAKRMALYSLLLLSCLVSLVGAQGWGNSTYVFAQAEDGLFMGRQFLIENTPINGFFGVPYAKPPVGELRWQRTVPTGKFDERKETFTASPVCPQIAATGMDVIGNEDCLYLDVIIGGVSEETLKPVVIFVNNFEYYRQGISHTGVMMAKREDVVVVSVNSRLGALGWLYDGPGTGNMGLWDNIAALKWVNRNIESFEGDPNKVTVMGIGSGATIAEMLAATPLAEGLFQHVITMSALNQEAQSLEPNNDVEMLRKLAGCSSSRTVTCNIDKLGAEEIVQSINYSCPNFDDKDLFPGGFDKTKLYKFPLLSGVASADRLFWSYDFIEEKTEDTAGILTQPVMDDIVQSLCKAGFNEPSTQCMCFNAIRSTFQLDQYAPYPNSEVVSLLSSYFHSKTIANILEHAKGRSADVNTYAYIVDITDDLERYELPSTATGADRSIMAKLVFGYSFLAFGEKFEFMNSEFYNGELFSGIDSLTMFGGKVELRPQTQDIMRYWANFIKSGNPSEGRRVDRTWPSYDMYNRVFISFDDTQVVGLKRYFYEHRNYEYFNEFFYESLDCIRDILEEDTDTSEETTSVIPISTTSEPVDTSLLRSTLSASTVSPTQSSTAVESMGTVLSESDSDSLTTGSSLTSSELETDSKVMLNVTASAIESNSTKLPITTTDTL
ncbi:carboxylesterase 4A-like [Watersipora subatra]|uniref:carboxylesterase 4A-like n=1 Tax=Watersipora subatra TaxID=2589382 RepID=UPI00355C40FA